MAKHTGPREARPSFRDRVRTILEWHGLTPAERLAAIAVIFHMLKDDLCYAGLPRLCTLAGYSPHSAKRMGERIDSLVAKGVLMKERQPGLTNVLRWHGVPPDAPGCGPGDPWGDDPWSDGPRSNSSSPMAGGTDEVMKETGDAVRHAVVPDEVGQGQALEGAGYGVMEHDDW